MRERCSVAIDGVVQGVGFRPFVHGLARACALDGYVCNDATGVMIEVEGDRTAISEFIEDLAGKAPPLARIETIRVEYGKPVGHAGFRIAESRASSDRSVIVAADAATCAACLAELFDPADRRYRYPFVNCTQCGPRLTIIQDVPYDRSRTTMAAFAMCLACRAEYEDPGDRRFHAQPIACPDCGPRLSLRQPSGDAASAEDPITAAAQALLAGRILAVKGLGGYHLACDAANAGAVERLRRRKRRWSKPLAVLVRDLSSARALCEVSGAEEVLLASPERPIVLLSKRTDYPIADAVAPGTPQLGVMLPYSPMHYLLSTEVDRPLVMTSGNRSDEPIAYEDREARERLADIADLFLEHDRSIESRCDDSVARVLRGGAALIRRSRGYAPKPLNLPVAARKPLLAMGGDLKNTFALVREHHAFLSHHVGDLEDFATYLDFSRTIRHYIRLLGIRPDLVVHDLHPGYQSARFAAEFDAVERLGVQHHHAHVAACMAEHGRAGPVIGVAFDGTGYGADGAIWGGEFLLAGYEGFERVGHLAYVRLPGGDAAVRQPWRTAVAHVLAAGAEIPPLVERIGMERWRAIARVAGNSALSVPTSSVGRLFDAVASLIGLRDEVQYEGQAAIELEAIADAREAQPYPIEISSVGGISIWEPAPVILSVVADLDRGRPRATIAGKFHASLREAIVTICERVRRERGVSEVALTGGVFQNALLTEQAVRALERKGFEVLIHRQVPANDGGLSLGQAAIGCATAARS